MEVQQSDRCCSKKAEERWKCPKDVSTTPMSELQNSGANNDGGVRRKQSRKVEGLGIEMAGYSSGGEYFPDPTNAGMVIRRSGANASLVDD